MNAVSAQKNRSGERDSCRDQYEEDREEPGRRQRTDGMQRGLQRSRDAIEQRRVDLRRRVGSLLHHIVDVAVSHESPPSWTFSNAPPASRFLRLSYARCAFCLTDPMLVEVARATSSSDIPEIFNMAITSRWLWGSVASRASRSGLSAQGSEDCPGISACSSRCSSRLSARCALR